MNAALLEKVVHDWIRMEQDAQVIDLLRKGVIISVTHINDWRVDTPDQFFIAPTLDEAVKKATR